LDGNGELKERKGNEETGGDTTEYATAEHQLESKKTFTYFNTASSNISLKRHKAASKAASKEGNKQARQQAEREILLLT
jgi:hypothetical protein